MPISPPEVLTARHDLTGFDCGKPALNAWLRTRALANQRNGFTVVVVIHDEQRVVGYYGLSPTAVEPIALPRKVRTGQPPNPVPCLLLGQLAMDLAYAGRDLGAALVAHALERAVLGARLFGGRALLVRAIDEDAVQFWIRRGFLAFPAQCGWLGLRRKPNRGHEGALIKTIAEMERSLIGRARGPVISSCAATASVRGRAHEGNAPFRRRLEAPLVALTG